MRVGRCVPWRQPIADAGLLEIAHVQDLVQIVGNPEHRHAGEEGLVAGRTPAIADDEAAAPGHEVARQVVGHVHMAGQGRRCARAGGGDDDRAAEARQAGDDARQLGDIARASERDVDRRCRGRQRIPPGRQRHGRRPVDEAEVAMGRRAIESGDERGGVGVKGQVCRRCRHGAGRCPHAERRAFAPGPAWAGHAAGMRAAWRLGTPSRRAPRERDADQGIVGACQRGRA